MQGLVNFYPNILAGQKGDLTEQKISLAGHGAWPLSIKHFENCLVKICKEKSLVNCFRYDFQPFLARKIISNFLGGGVGRGGGGWELKDFLVKRNVFERVYWSF